MSTGDKLLEIKRHLQLMKNYFWYNLSSAMEYRGSFLLQLFGMVLNNASFIIFWWLVFSRVEHIGGYGFREVMFLWALASAAFGIAHIFFGNISSLSNLIIKGELDPYLLQPKDVCLNIICSRMIISAWGDLAYGIVLYLIIYGFQLGQFMLFCGFILFSGVLMASIIFLAQTFTFFLGNASSIAGLITEFLITLTLYPESIFKGAAHVG